MRESTGGKKAGSASRACQIHKEWRKEGKKDQGRWYALELRMRLGNWNWKTGIRVKITYMLPRLVWFSRFPEKCWLWKIRDRMNKKIYAWRSALSLGKGHGGRKDHCKWSATKLWLRLGTAIEEWEGEWKLSTWFLGQCGFQEETASDAMVWDKGMA